MRRSIVVALVLLATAFLFVGGPSLLFSPSTSDVAPETEDEPEPEIVSFEDSESGFWPYLNAQQTHEKRSPLNVIARGETDTTVRLLTAYGTGDWEETEDDHFEADEFVGLADNETDEAAGNDTADEPNATAELTQELSTTGRHALSPNETGEPPIRNDTAADPADTIPDSDSESSNSTPNPAVDTDTGLVSGTETDSSGTDTAGLAAARADSDPALESPSDSVRESPAASGATAAEHGEDRDQEPSQDDEPADDERDHDIRPVSPTDIPWSQADGATRFAYLDPGPGEPAYWTTETLQLEDGEYYGYRYHIRLYESPNPDDRWVVMQTHSEHFDWFTLRHRVDGAEAAQSRLERDLMAIPGVDHQEDLQRIYLDNSGPSDANGWATKVDLTFSAAAIVPLLAGVILRRRSDRQVLDFVRDRPRFAADGTTEGRAIADEDGRDGTDSATDAAIGERIDAALDDWLTDADRARLAAAADRLEPRHLMLTATILTIILGVRIAGIALDRSLSFLTVHTIATLLYPFIAVGLPVATYAIASGLERRLDAALAASLSLAVAIWFDYSLLGIDVLPLDVVVQRMLVVVALGLIAGGAATRATRDSRLNDMLVAGVTMWVLVLAGTMFGYL